MRPKNQTEKRHDAILAVIDQRQIKTQQDLLDALCEQGFEVTQATLSRDMKRLGIVKGDGVAQEGYYRRQEATAIHHPDRLMTVFLEAVIEVKPANTLLVVKTLPGMAQAAASALDAMSNPNVVGTLAGDDTLFLAMADQATTRQMHEDLVALLRQHRRLV